MDRTTYINSLIGRSWAEDRHCWSLVRETQSDLFGRALPAMPVGSATAGLLNIADVFASHDERANWREVATPVDGAIALMARKTADIHCGVYLTSPQPGILHCDEAQGVRFEPVLTLGFYWHRIRYFVPLPA